MYEGLEALIELTAEARWGKVREGEGAAGEVEGQPAGLVAFDELL